MYKAIFSSVAALALSSSVGLAAPIFSTRENVNVLNSDLASVTATVDAAAASQKVTAAEQTSGPSTWFGTPSNSITANLGASRNVKTVRVSTGFGGYKAGSAVIETSSDGIGYTPQAHVLVNANATNQSFTLSTAVNAQYVRLTPTSFQEAPDNRWAVNQFRIYGDSGATLAPGEHLDLLSSSALDSTIVPSLIGSVAYEDAPYNSLYVNDNPSLIIRKVMYSMDTGDGFKFDMGQSILFSKMGVTFHYDTSFLDVNAAIKVSVSTDDISYAPVYKNYTGPDGLPVVFDTIETGLNFLELTDTTGRYIKFEYILTTGGNRIADTMIFQAVPVPEPLAVGALGVMIPMMLRRRAK